LYDEYLQMFVLIHDDKLSPGDYILNLKYVGRIYDDIKDFFRYSYGNTNVSRFVNKY